MEKFMDDFFEDENPQEIKGEPVPDTDDNRPGMTKITLGDRAFYANIHESYRDSLNLLERGVETAEEAYSLQKLLKVLKSRVVVIAVDGDGCETDGPAARRAFVEALKEREALHAYNLKERLSEQDAEW